MKKRLIAFLLTFLTMFSFAHVKAYSADTQVISFNNIKSIMIENSIDMKMADNDLKDTKQEMEKINDDIEDLGYKGSSISSSIKDLEDQIEEYEDEISELDKTDENYITNKENLETKKASAEKTLSDLKDYKEKRTTAQRNLKKAELTYNQTVEDAVYKAQQSYISCLSTISQIQNKKDSLEYNEKKADIYKLQYENGFLSKKEYEDAVRDNTDSQNEINQLENAQETALNNLKLTLGISQGEDITLSNDIEADLNSVLSIDYKEDLKEMLKNSVDISIADLELQWAKDDDDDDDDDDYENYSLENKELNLDKQYTTLEITFKEKYNDLMTAYNSIKSSYDKLQQSQEDYGVLSKKYSFGFITKNELEKAKIDLDSSTADFNTERNEFYLKYLDYSQMKEGY